MIGVFRLESQMLPGSGKFERTGLGSDREPKEASNTAFNFLKANSNRISGSISTTTKDYIVNYQDLLDNGSLAAAREKGIVGMEGKDYVVKDGDVILFRFNV